MKDIMPKIQEPSLEDKIRWEYDKELRELKISRAKAKVLLKNTVNIYETLDNIRFDYLSDTMFRDYYVKAKISLEGAIGDFLLDDNYWKERINNHLNTTPKEYYKKYCEFSNGQTSTVIIK